MKILEHARMLSTGFLAAPVRKLSQALRDVHAAAWQEHGYCGQYEDIDGLDRRVLDEIGLTPELIHFDASQPVWWR